MGAVPSPFQDADFSLIDRLVIPASVHDVEGRFVHVNEAAERASGKTVGRFAALNSAAGSSAFSARGDRGGPAPRAACSAGAGSPAA